MINLRVEYTRDLVVDLCEPHRPITHGMQIAQCQCGRCSGRLFGRDFDPWVECVCGVRFNSNTNWLGIAK